MRFPPGKPILYGEYFLGDAGPPAYSEYAPPRMTDAQRRTPPSPSIHLAAGQRAASESHDRALVRRMAGGDESALADLYDAWADRVHTLACWILRDADEAEDVVEETFWQAWRTASRYDGERAGGGTWLLMIARCRAIDRLRARRRRTDWTAAFSTNGSLLDGAGAEPPGAEEERRERYSVLASALEGLPREQREAVEMAFYGGLSHAEIAAQMAQPLGTVKTRIRLAIQKLRQRLASLRDGDL